MKVAFMLARSIAKHNKGFTLGLIILFMILTSFVVMERFTTPSVFESINDYAEEYRVPDLWAVTEVLPTSVGKQLPDVPEIVAREYNLVMNARCRVNGKTVYTLNLTGMEEDGFRKYHLEAENIRVATSLVEEPMPVEEALALVGLAEKADRYPGKMSGGEQQRVCIARAIAKRPQILLCDEPTGALDPGNARLVMKTLTDLVRKQHMAVVMITHNTAFRSLADHYIVMSAGRIEEDVRQPFPLPVEMLSLH